MVILENYAVLQLLTLMAVKLGTTVEYLWAVLVKQALVDSVTNIVMWVVLAVVTYIFSNVAKKQDLDYNDYARVGVVIGTIAITILWLAAFFSIPETVNGFINPEYEAIKTVLEAVKPASD